MCKCTEVKVALNRYDFRFDEVEQYSRRDNIVVHGLREEDSDKIGSMIRRVATTVFTITQALTSSPGPWMGSIVTALFLDFPIITGKC